MRQPIMAKKGRKGAKIELIKTGKIGVTPLHKVNEILEYF
jgi:hypothetical protein